MGYVELYTDILNFQQFLLNGSCVADIRKDKDEHKIIVPRECVKDEVEDLLIEYRMKYQVEVDLGNKFQK